MALELVIALMEKLVNKWSLTKDLDKITMEEFLTDHPAFRTDKLAASYLPGLLTVRFCELKLAAEKSKLLVQ